MTVDAGTQYSPPAPAGTSPVQSSPSRGKRKDRSPILDQPPPEPDIKPKNTMNQSLTRNDSKDHHNTTPSPPPTATPTISDSPTAINGSSPKRPRPLAPPSTATTKLMPARYENCSTSDLVSLIASMLMELIRFNDSIPLANHQLTRFHSRAPPSISVIDYLQRLTTHATLSPPILLSMVYYIDRLCALYPAFTISSLTVHRFLIASATVASKGLSDSFWTNNTYAKVGGVSLKELALLELEFLWRIEWRIVPKPEVLVDYYRSLVERSEGFEIEDDAMGQVDGEGGEDGRRGIQDKGKGRGGDVLGR